LGIEIRYYELLPEKGWEINLDHVRSLIDAKTKAFLVVNPSNPCSTVYTIEHQLEIIKVAQEFKIPLLCDEVYYGLVFPGQKFESFANLTDDVPMLCINSLSKVYQVPGWRVGWIIVYNRHGYLDVVKDHISKYLRIPFHPNTLVLNALPRILKETPQSYFDDYCQKLAEASTIVYERLSQIKGITPIKATAAMYMMVRLNFEQWKEGHGIEDDKDFVLKLWEAESVLLLPS
jgi:tyrosine aminotransferase